MTGPVVSPPRPLPPSAATTTNLATGKLSKAETIKRDSRALRGGLAAALSQDDPGFNDPDRMLLKFHGIYQGYNRDTATARKKQGLDKEHGFMARVKIPGGLLTAEQYLELDRLADLYGGQNMRITTRQGIQFHGLIKRDLWPTIHAVNQALLTTLAACGDVVRNITATPAPIRDVQHRLLQEQASYLTKQFLPKTRAYPELWVDGEPVTLDEATNPASAAAEADDPLYGAAYLPRKFKIGLATPDDNSIDVLINDLAVVALFGGDQLQGYNLAVGGGLGMTHNKPKTYPRLATPLAFVPPDDLTAAIRAVIGVQRDFGDRADRKHARLKYLVDDKGTPWVKAMVEHYFGAALEDPRPTPAFRVVDHMGWHPQGDGHWYLGVFVASGRIQDRGSQRQRSALRRIIGEFCPTPILTATQDILLADIAEADKPLIDAILRDHGVPPAETLSMLDKFALACPALPTCGLALTEAERIRDPLVAEIEQALDRHGLRDAAISLRITGCPNGCARPYAGEIGIVGRTPGSYAIFLGGDFEGTRLNHLVFERVPLTSVAATLERVFAFYVETRRAGESFGDFCHRHPPERLRDLAANLAQCTEVA